MNVLPSCPFPNHLWYHYALTSQNICVDVHEHYVKQTLRNRFYIPAVNGLALLTIPIEGQGGEKVAMKDIRLAPGKWRKLNFTSIKSAYGKSPFYEHFEHELADFWNRSDQFLLDFNRASSELCMDLLGIDMQMVESDEYLPSADGDLRGIFKNNSSEISTTKYHQVFSDRHPFFPNTSILDLLFNLGPETESYLRGIKPF